MIVFHQFGSVGVEDVRHVAFHLLVGIAQSHDGRAHRAQLDGTVGEGGGIGVFLVVEEDVEVDARQTVLDVVAQLVGVGHIGQVDGAAHIVVEVQFGDDEVTARASANDVGVHQVGVDGKRELVLALRRTAQRVDVDRVAIEHELIAEIRPQTVADLGTHVDVHAFGRLHPEPFIRCGVLQLEGPVVERRH